MRAACHSAPFRPSSGLLGVDLVDRLLEGQVNAAIVYCPEQRPDLRHERLSDQPALAVMHPEHRFVSRSSLTVADLGSEVLVLAEPAIGACYNSAVLALFQRAGDAPETTYINGYLPPRGYDPASMIGVTTEVALYGVPPSSFERVCVPISDQTLPFDLVWHAERETPLVSELCRIATQAAEDHNWPRA